MALERCGKGHHWDPFKHLTCPHCEALDLEIATTKPKRPIDPPAIEDAESGKTIVLLESDLGIDPPVGWLVCLEGPDRGEDYRIRAGNNSIGRAKSMKISIEGDPGISRENHAFILYDPESSVYMVRPGDAAGLVHHNRKLVTESVRLNPFDRIRLGKTTLVFVPLCVDFGDERTVSWL